jgi:dihydrofolate reductase
MSSFEMMVAFDSRGRICDLPWYLPEDLQFFRQMTENQVVIMSEKTYGKLANRPILGRINIIISGEPEKIPTNITVFSCKIENYAKVLEKLAFLGRRIFIIGGEEIYGVFLPLCTLFHLTVLYEEVGGTGRFPMKWEQFETEMYENGGRRMYKRISYTDELLSKTGMKYKQFCYRREPG